MSYLEIKKIKKFSEREGEEGVLKRQLRGCAQKKLQTERGKGRGGGERKRARASVREKYISGWHPKH